MANNNLITVDVLASVLGAFKESLQKNDSLNAVTESQDSDVPVLFITGSIPDSKNYVNGELEYTSKTLTFKAYTKIKLQGTSTLALPKKNFTFKLFSDEWRTMPLSINFRNWGSSNIFTLKADYNDILHARNIVCSNLWSKVVASRHDYDSLPEELRNSPNNGAIDGFPVKVYINNEYVGLYGLVTNKNAKLFGMNENNPKHTVLQAEFNDNGNSSVQKNPCNFNTVWNGEDTYWSVEVGNDVTNIKNKFQTLYENVHGGYVNNVSDAITRSLDKQSLIDYYILQDVILGTDGLAKNMLLVTYDLDKWYLSAYDLDATFDLSWEGELLNSSRVSLFGDDGRPAINNPYLNHYSILPSIIGNFYSNDYIERYAELRESVLSYSSIMYEFEKYINSYGGEDEAIKDTIANPDIPLVTTNTLSYLRTFVKEHLEYLDSKYLN